MPIPANHSKPVRQSAKESAYNQIQQWIIDGTLQPGEKLNDSELAQALGISRTPVRESLQLLETEGFVQMFPGKATQVTEVEKESMKDLLPPLAALQALSAELAIENLTSDVLTLLEKTNDRFAKAIHSENYYAALKIDEEFHQIIVDTANNPYIHRIVAHLQAHVRRLFFHNSIILTEKSIEEHAQIIELMKEGETVTLSHVMKENWLRTIDEIESLQ
ncbi:GntR family transcriptional regulator [Virgibacillus pantothenticus]|uniref:GntR family transcriptional regulator n=1 Tax=Virgibacillus pantothenticus TaxID=1473 RepID=A0A0L0QKE9_VIRPA|nr:MULTISPECIES: GntR family transcriptional regulator [Virgibacillus]API92761.1 GntR family transcriptional regulator [Virgibacillus sp. 6R]KNE18999.1 GntR family transcriptional regulator [Virgibacillus pantothenticus]MBS7428263.1 GntR family transcriptional regulator [Virgibacillus sp. 19R1-5]MBU8565303.1 GntR family transcriptional regulator [Virgibacillus pantothenticus]MBU8599477.1 GntR family transcriptional regulator [Virgibacillus pantothenticus]